MNRLSAKSLLSSALAALALHSSCATVSQIPQPKVARSSLEAKTAPDKTALPSPTSSQIRKKMTLFQKALDRGPLSVSDWKIHDELLAHYITLKEGASGRLAIPPRSRIHISIETYCLNPGRAPPSENEVYRWQKSRPDLKYYPELLALRRNGQIKQADLQELLWNIGNQTPWEDYPDRLTAILLRIDPNASTAIPSRLKDRATNFLLDSLTGTPGLSEVSDAYDLIKGQYYNYDDFRQSIESQKSKQPLSIYDDLARIPETELYSQSKSHGFSEQEITFYNPTLRPHAIDITTYYLVPERNDVQSIGVNLVGDLALFTDLEKLLFESMARAGVGFIPMLGDAADLYETIYGKDFLTAQSLSWDERVASAAGIILGSGSAYRHAKRWVHSPAEYLPKFENEFAKAVNRTQESLNYRKLNELVSESSKTANELKAGLDYEGTKALSAFLRDASVKRIERIETIRSFEPGTIRSRVSQKDEIVYRWHNEDADVKRIGRYVSPDRIEDPSSARLQLALPTQNKMVRLDQFTLKSGSRIFEGKIAPYNGQPGGARQILIVGNPEKTLIFKQRVK